MGVTNINAASEAEYTRKRNAYSNMAPILIGATILGPGVIQTKSIRGPWGEACLQKDVIKHFKGEQTLDKDVFENTKKLLNEKTFEYLKNNKKLDWAPIAKRFGAYAGVIVGIYALSGLLIRNLDKKYGKIN